MWNGVASDGSSGPGSLESVLFTKASDVVYIKETAQGNTVLEAKTQRNLVRKSVGLKGRGLLRGQGRAPPSPQRPGQEEGPACPDSGGCGRKTAFGLLEAETCLLPARTQALTLTRVPPHKASVRVHHVCHHQV